MPKKTLSGTGERIRIDESADAGIVISALQVVEPGISVVVVAGGSVLIILSQLKSNGYS